MNPEDTTEKHFTRLKPEQKRALNKLEIKTIGDLLYLFPARYESAGQTGTIAGGTAGAEVTLYGTVRKPDIRKTWESRRPIAEARLEDAPGKIKMMWFSQPYIAKSLYDGMVVKVSGRVAGAGAKLYLANPSIDKSPVAPDAVHENLFVSSAESLAPSALFPIYPESQGVSSLWFLHAIKRVFPAEGAPFGGEDPIPSEILKRYSLPSLSVALVFIHSPRRLADSMA